MNNKVYVIGCIRLGNYPRLNRMGKGKFYLKFKSLSELAKFSVENSDKLLFDYRTLTNKEYRIFRLKYRSMNRKKFNY